MIVFLPSHLFTLLPHPSGLGNYLLESWDLLGLKLRHNRNSKFPILDIDSFNGICLLEENWIRSRSVLSWLFSSAGVTSSEIAPSHWHVHLSPCPLCGHSPWQVISNPVFYRKNQWVRVKSLNLPQLSEAWFICLTHCVFESETVWKAIPRLLLVNNAFFLRVPFSADPVR